MTSYRRYRQGDVVLVPFPFTDITQSKKRPAVVVSANWYNNQMADCVLVAITSTVHAQLQRDEILITGAEVKQSGLLFEGVVKAGKIFTIEKGRIVRPLGRLTAATQGKVLDKLVEVISNL